MATAHHHTTHQQHNPDCQRSEEAGEGTPLLPGREPSCRRRAWQAVRRAVGVLTVEPVVLLFIVGIGVGSVLEERLWIDKTCRFHFHYSEEVCKTLYGGHHQQEQLAVQSQVAVYHLYLKLITHVPSIPVVLLLGTWSDMRGRRKPVLLSLSAFALEAMGMLATSWWWTMPPEYLLLCYVPVGLTGGHAALVLACNAYLSTATGNRERTTRFSLIMVVLGVGTMAGQAVALILFHHGWYIAVFATKLGLIVTAIVYCLAFLKDRPDGGHEQ